MILSERCFFFVYCLISCIFTYTCESHEGETAYLCTTGLSQSESWINDETEIWTCRYLIFLEQLGSNQNLLFLNKKSHRNKTVNVKYSRIMEWFHKAMVNMWFFHKHFQISCDISAYLKLVYKLSSAILIQHKALAIINVPTDILELFQKCFIFLYSKRNW